MPTTDQIHETLWLVGTISGIFGGAIAVIGVIYKVVVWLRKRFDPAARRLRSRRRLAAVLSQAANNTLSTKLPSPGDRTNQEERGVDGADIPLVQLAQEDQGVDGEVDIWLDILEV